jgi:hypothetical protein
MKRNTMYDFEKEIWCGMTSYYILPFSALGHPKAPQLGENRSNGIEL